MQLPKNAQRYVTGTIAVGFLALLCSLYFGKVPGAGFLVYLALAVTSSVFKIRLHGVDGAFSLNFLCLLAGVTYYTLEETVVACCAGAIAGTLLNRLNRPKAVQVAFNIANHVLSVCVAYLAAHQVFHDGLASYRPAWLAVVAATYFVVNTLIVSGILTLLSNQTLADVNGRFYLWSLPYYLTGAAVVGVLPIAGNQVSPESWLVPLPLLYLIHFFYGLERGKGASGGLGEGTPDDGMRPAGAYFSSVVIGLGCLLAGMALMNWSSQDAGRFVAYTAAGVVASMCKVTLPGLRGTMSCGFVLGVVAIVEMSLAEMIALAVVMSLAQAAWRPKSGHVHIRQLLFSTSALAISTAASGALCRWVLLDALRASLPVVLVVATAVLYCLNSMLVSTVMCLAEGRPLANLFERFYFWGLPYYLVGAVASGLMVVTARNAEWMASLLVLPAMGLVYYSYLLHVRSASAPAKA
jgi:hypothetical protein